MSLKPQEQDVLDGKKIHHKSKAATVAVVNENNDLVLWAFIKRMDVCQFFPSVTRLDQTKLDFGIEASVVSIVLRH